MSKKYSITAYGVLNGGQLSVRWWLAVSPRPSSAWLGGQTRHTPKSAKLKEKEDRGKEKEDKVLNKG